MTSEGYRDGLQRLFAEQQAARERWLRQLPAELRALLPLDATPIAQGLELLADAVGIGQRVREAQRAGSQANSAVLHGRVYGRGAALPQETALAAFADGARVREPLLLELAAAVDGGELQQEVAALLGRAPLPEPGAPLDQQQLTQALDAVFTAQRAALLHCATRLDAVLDG